MNKVDYHFNPASLKLIIGYSGTRHKTRVERNTVHQIEGWLRDEDNGIFLKGANSLAVRDENGKLIKKL